MGSFNQTNGDFFAPKTFRDRFGGVNTMKSSLGVDKMTPALERSFKAATKLKGELPTDLEMESIPTTGGAFVLGEDIHARTREVSQKTNLDIQEFLGIYKALQSIQGDELLITPQN